MNGRSTKSGSVNNFDFDLGINSSRSQPLNAQKNNTFTQPKPNTTTTPSWQPNKPSWSHQPAAPTPASTIGGPTSMVGDITGKSWASTAPSATNIGIPNKNPNLFSDLLGSKLGVGKSNNVPLKNVSATKSAYSMGGMADSLPKSGNNVKNGGSGSNWGSGSSNYNTSGYGIKNQNPSMKSSASTMSGIGIGIGGGNKDPFGSLVDFSSKPKSVKTNKASKPEDNVFGSFQNAPKPSTTSFTGLDDFGFGGMQNPPPVQSSGSNTNSMGKVDDFGFGGMQNPPPVQSSVGNDFDMLFPSSSAPTNNDSESFMNQQFAGAEDWGMESEIGGTTELEGLPPPPAGVTASSAKIKGMENYKAGQYPDAIKWLSWAVILAEKAGDNAASLEILSPRASCYKEVGEYKKAVADCSKVLETDGKNVQVLVQRALLYESMEKYKLGADDLRTVMNIDPGNRVARSTIHRLSKLAN